MRFCGTISADNTLFIIIGTIIICSGAGAAAVEGQPHHLCYRQGHCGRYYRSVVLLLSLLLVILVCFQARLIQFFFLYPPCAASSSLLVADAVVLYVVYTTRCIQTAVHLANKVTEYIFALNSLGLTLSHYFHLDNNYK